MKIQLKNYKEQEKVWPSSGHHIMAQYDEEKIIVYQSYRKEIGDFAVINQYFGGAFSLDRMTWIKPNFLWMMYRNSWGTKHGQEVVLAIHLNKKAFLKYLKHAVYSSYKTSLYDSRENWQKAIKESDVRLQWDPDHNPYGDKLERRAIQIGLRNEFIKSYAKKDIIEIEDISAYVEEQRKFVMNNELDKLTLPHEKPFLIEDQELKTFLQIT